MRIAGLVAAVALAAAWASLARAVAATRDADCRDWACARREMLAVIDEEFVDVGDDPGASIRNMTQAAEFVTPGSTGYSLYGDNTLRGASGWLQCSTVDWSDVRLADAAAGGGRVSLDALDNPELQAIFIGSLSLGELCDPENGTMRDDATCKAVRAAFRATIRLREEFQYGPRFWKSAAGTNERGVEPSAVPHGAGDRLTRHALAIPKSTGSRTGWRGRHRTRT